MTDVPAPRCAVQWCRAPHRSDDVQSHAARLGTWQAGALMLELFIGEAESNEPIVRIAWSEGGEVATVRDIAPELAGELADLVERLDGQTLQELAAALRHAASVL